MEFLDPMGAVSSVLRAAEESVNCPLAVNMAKCGSPLYVIQVLQCSFRTTFFFFYSVLLSYYCLMGFFNSGSHLCQESELILCIRCVTVLSRLIFPQVCLVVLGMIRRPPASSGCPV